MSDLKSFYCSKILLINMLWPLGLCKCRVTNIITNMYSKDMFKVKTQAGTRWPCCHCKSCKTKLEHENKTFYCCCCIAAVARCRTVLPLACHGLSYYCQGETRGEPGHGGAAWTHDRWWLHAAEQWCQSSSGNFQVWFPLFNLHGERHLSQF